MTEEIRFGIVGTGMMGIEHIMNLQAIEGNVIKAICDPNEKSLNTAREVTNGEAECFTNHEELLASGKVDALVVATPNMTHTEILLDVIEAKIPVQITHHKIIGKSHQSYHYKSKEKRKWDG